MEWLLQSHYSFDLLEPNSHTGRPLVLLYHASCIQWCSCVSLWYKIPINSQEIVKLIKKKM